MLTMLMDTIFWFMTNLVPDLIGIVMDTLSLVASVLALATRLLLDVIFGTVELTTTLVDVLISGVLPRTLGLASFIASTVWSCVCDVFTCVLYVIGIVYNTVNVIVPRLAHVIGIILEGSNKVAQAVIYILRDSIKFGLSLLSRGINRVHSVVQSKPINQYQSKSNFDNNWWFLPRSVGGGGGNIIQALLVALLLSLILSFVIHNRHLIVDGVRYCVVKIYQWWFINRQNDEEEEEEEDGPGDIIREDPNDGARDQMRINAPLFQVLPPGPPASPQRINPPRRTDLPSQYTNSASLSSFSQSNNQSPQQSGASPISTPSSPTASEPEKEESGQDQQSRLCIVCLDEDRQVLLRPCRHYCVCEECSKRLRGVCPVCRSPIQRSEVIHIFYD